MRRAWARFARTPALASTLLVAAGLSTAHGQPPGERSEAADEAREGAPEGVEGRSEVRAEEPAERDDEAAAAGEAGASARDEEAGRSEDRSSARPEEAGRSEARSSERPEEARSSERPEVAGRSEARSEARGDEAGASGDRSSARADETGASGARSSARTDEAAGSSGARSSARTDEAAGSSAATGEDGDDEAAVSAPSSSGSIRYVLERIEVRSNGGTDPGVILGYVPLRPGEVLDVEDPRIESIRWQLLGTGWFEDVRLRLERGAERGHVVLVIDVRERNTFLVQSVALGFSEGVVHTLDPNARLDPYFGISVAELNLFGTGVGLEATALLSVGQQGVRLRGGVASVAGSDWGLTATAFFNNGREFFGNDDVIVAVDECPPDGAMRCEEGRNAVVFYRRYGASLGTGYDLSPNLRFTLDYQLEAVELVDRPDAASHRRGTEIVPIDFAIHDGLSWISSLQLGLTHDERDNPALPTDGRFVFVRADLSTTLIGSSYDFVRVQAGWREWFRLPEAHHTLRLGLFVGGAVGDVPFFYKFYASDLSDLIPSRMLQLNLDRRAPPNLFGTAVGEMRAQELAGRVDVEYAIWVYEGGEGLRGLQIYGLVGLYALMDREDLRVAIPGYAGPARAPIDLTFDVGLRFDTVVGVFELGFSTLVGFVSL